MTSDETTRAAPDVPFKPRGLGLAMLFRCAACSNHSSTLGRGLRRVNGLRTYVCKACKERIDARAKTG